MPTDSLMDNASLKSLHGDSRWCPVYKGTQLRIEPSPLPLLTVTLELCSALCLHPVLLHQRPQRTEPANQGQGLWNRSSSFSFLWCPCGVGMEPQAFNRLRKSSAPQPLPKPFMCPLSCFSEALHLSDRKLITGASQKSYLCLLLLSGAYKISISLKRIVSPAELTLSVASHRWGSLYLFQHSLERICEIFFCPYLCGHWLHWENKASLRTPLDRGTKFYHGGTS